MVRIRGVNSISLISLKKETLLISLTKRRPSDKKESGTGGKEGLLFVKSRSCGSLFVKFNLFSLPEPITWFLKPIIAAIPKMEFSDSEIGPNISSRISFTNGFGYMSVLKFVPGIDSRLSCTFGNCPVRTGTWGVQGSPR